MFFSVSNPDWIKKAWAAATYMITDRPILTVTNTSDPTFRAVNQSSGQALRGSSTSGEGIFGYSRDNSGIYGESKGTSINAAGVFGKGNSTYGGVFSTSSSQRGQVRLLSESLYSPELNDTCRAGELRARYDAKDVWLMFCSRNCNNSLGVNKTCQWEYIAVSGTQLPRAP
jgi:hypothetical protein